MLRALFVGLSMLLVIGCGTSPRPAKHLIVSGSRTMAPLMRDIAKRFEAKYPGTRIGIEPGPAERAATDTRNGLADIGMLARPLRPDESSLHSVAVGSDGIAFILHRGNPVPDLDERQLVGLFTRTYTNWREVGGSDRAVTLVGLADGRALHEVFLEQFALPSSRVKIEAPVTSSDQAIQAVSQHPHAIGYVCLGRAELAATKVPIRLLPLGGVAATLANVRAGRYPFTRPLLLLTRDRPDGVVRDLLDFARSDEVRDLLDLHGFAPPRNQD